MELGYLLTRSGLTYPEVSSKVCQLGSSVLLPWVIYFETFYFHVLIVIYIHIYIWQSKHGNRIYIYIYMYDSARNGIHQNLRRCKMYLNIDASCFSLLRNINLFLQIIMLYFVDIFGNIGGWGNARMNLEQKSQSKLLNIQILHLLENWLWGF